MLESHIEKSVRAWVEEQGGIWIKLLADGRKGIPDNLLLFPPIVLDQNTYPIHIIIELKRPKGVVSAHQEWWLNELSKLWQPTHVCYSLDHVKDVHQHVVANLKRKVLGPGTQV